MSLEFRSVFIADTFLNFLITKKRKRKSLIHYYLAFLSFLSLLYCGLNSGPSPGVTPPAQSWIQTAMLLISAS
jgi:hypothetical protein